MPFSIRFKRKATTVFLFCDPAEKFESIKLRVRYLHGPPFLTPHRAWPSSVMHLSPLRARLPRHRDARAPTATYPPPPSTPLFVYWRPSCACAQLCPLFGAATPAELRLVADDKATVFANEAMVQDFPLNDESICYVTFGAEEAPGE